MYKSFDLINTLLLKKLSINKLKFNNKILIIKRIYENIKYFQNANIQ